MAIDGRSYLSLQNEVLEFQFNPGKYRALVKTWLNDAQRIAVIESEIRVQEESASYATISADSSLELPADFSRTIDLHDTEEDRRLTKISLRELDDLPDETGRPSVYAVEKDEILLYPVPDGAYKLALRYWRLPEDMEADGDEPEIPKQHHHRLIPYAMWKAYLRENDYPAANVWKAEWEREMLKMRGEAQHDTFDGPQQVAGSYGNAPVWR